MKRKKEAVVDEVQKFINEDEAALSDHLKAEHQLQTPENFDEHYIFTVLGFCTPNNLDKSELKWISDLKTSVPFGLNIAKPFGVGETLLTQSSQ